MDTFEILTQYGVLGIWVLYAITRERWLLRKIEEISERASKERLEERNSFIRQIQKILNENNGIKSTQTKNNRGRKKSS